MSKEPNLLTAVSFVSLFIYLFVSAPPPMSEETYVGATIPIERVLKIVEAENDIVRALWTKEIVGEGKKVGLQFDEDWHERGVETGPLPALFLRETAKSLEKQSVRLSLYLGSDFPINSANRLSGKQREMFDSMKKTEEPMLFYDTDTELYTAIFPDIAVAPGCVTCHNKHQKSLKHDWKLYDVMGATTWSYPNKSVTLDEAIAILAALRQSFKDAYSAYLQKTISFSEAPEIGKKWPREGYFIPSLEIFMDEVVKLTSAQTLNGIMAAFPSSQTPIGSFSEKPLEQAGLTLDRSRRSNQNG